MIDGSPRRVGGQVDEEQERNTYNIEGLCIVYKWAWEAMRSSGSGSPTKMLQHPRSTSGNAGGDGDGGRRQPILIWPIWLVCTPRSEH